MKIGIKLALGFSIIVIAMLATIFLCLNTNNKVRKEFEVLADDIMPSAIAIITMEKTCNQIAHDLMDYTISGDEKEERAVKTGLKSLEETITETLKQKKHVSLEQQKSAEELRAKTTRFTLVCTEIVNLKRQGLSTNEILEKEEENLHPVMDALLTKLRRYKSRHMRDLAKAKGSVYHAHISGEQIALLVSFAIAFLSAMIALSTTRSIVRPLHALHKGTEKIGKGNLNYKVGTKTKDEIGQLSRAFDEMTQNLKTTTTSIDKLDAVNEQLQVNEEQLKTVNQQLASEVAERKKTQEALEVSNRDLTDFVYVASHDLREPLRKISSFGQLLQKSLQDKLSDDDRENLGFMIDGSDRMTMMIDGLLTYSRVNTKDIQRETVDLNEIIERLKKLELGMLLDETSSTIEIPQPLPKVYADPVQIEQLLQNLIANGIKYRKDEVKPIITIRAKEFSDNEVRIEVQDNGIGIAPEYCDDIFKMFKRLHSSKKYKGHGIGLAVCRKIVDRHAGRMGVESEPGAGSIFWFTIPLAKDAAPISEPATVA